MLPAVGLAGCISKSPDDLKSPDDPGTTRPNIILLMADDVAPQHLGCYGGKIPTPHLDRLAGEGMKFTRAYATSAACTPSRYSIMTGQYAGRCQDPEFLDENPAEKPYKIAWNTPITNENITMHEILKEAGYYTGFVGKFHIGPLEFDNHETNHDMPDIDPNMDVNTPEADSLLALYQKCISEKAKELIGCDYTASIQYENPEGIPIKAVQRHHVEWTTKGAMEFLNQAETKEKPFFLHLNTTTLHGPNHIDDLQTDAHFSPEGRLDEPYKYHPERKTIFERLDKAGIPYEDIPDHVKHYHTGIPYMDDHVGIILDKLDKMGIAENTIVIYTADHSTEPGKSSCYEKGIKVPFVVRWPGKIDAGSESNEMVQFVDFLPTFAAAAETDVSEENKIDGTSIIPAFKGKKLQREFLFSEMGYLRAVSNDKYKYVAMRFPDEAVERLTSGKQKTLSHLGSDVIGFAGIVATYFPGYFDADQLYDLENDPYEQNNLAYDSDYADVLKKMKAALNEKVSSFNHPYPMDNTEYINLPEYKASIRKMKETGITVWWWNRDINYPPAEGEIFYY